MITQLDKHIAISYLQAVGLYWMGVAAERSGDMSAYTSLVPVHCTVRRDKACVRSSPDPSLSCRSGSGLRD